MTSQPPPFILWDGHGAKAVPAIATALPVLLFPDSLHCAPSDQPKVHAWTCALHRPHFIAAGEGSCNLFHYMLLLWIPGWAKWGH